MEKILDCFGRWIDTYGILWIVGQGFGVVAIVLGFVSYQLKTKRQLLFMQSGVSVMFCLHYFLIGAYSGMVANVLNIVRNIVYDTQTDKKKNNWIPYLFVILHAVLCIIAWDAWYSIFVLIGIGINTYCMSLPNPQTVRKSILITSPLVLIYDVFAGSLGGIIYESVAIISSIIGIIKNKKL